MRSFRFTLLIALAVVVIDQQTKRLATAQLAGRGPVPLLGELVQLTYTRNSGVAFGLGAGTHFPFWLFSGIAAIGIVALLIARPAMPMVKRIALALVLGGALGNLIDRVRFGEVVDFILLSWHQHQFPVFNVADSAVSIGVALFALSWSRAGEGDQADDGAGGGPRGDSEHGTPADGPGDGGEAAHAGASGRGEARG
jgi:signal peptidase II